MYWNFLFKAIDILNKNFKIGKLSTKELKGQSSLINEMICSDETDNADIEAELKSTLYKFYKDPIMDFEKE